MIWLVHRWMFVGWAAGCFTFWWPLYQWFLDFDRRTYRYGTTDATDKVMYGCLATLITAVWPVLVGLGIIPVVSRRLWTGSWFGQADEHRKVSS